MYGDSNVPTSVAAGAVGTGGGGAAAASAGMTTMSMFLFGVSVAFVLFMVYLLVRRMMTNRSGPLT